MIRRLICIFTIKLKELQESIKNYLLKILNLVHYEKKQNFKGGGGMKKKRKSRNLPKYR